METPGESPAHQSQAALQCMEVKGHHSVTQQGPEEVIEDDPSSAARVDGEGSSDRNESVEMTTAKEGYGYLTRGLFTTELFKIELRNLPNYFGIKQLRKKLLSLGLNPKKIKSPDKSDYAFITFGCAEDRSMALNQLQGHKWKGRNLSAKEAAPAKDPMTLKRGPDSTTGGLPYKRRQQEDSGGTPALPLQVRFKNSVTSLWHLSYEEQLKSKQDKMADCLVRLRRDVMRLYTSAGIPRAHHPVSQFRYRDRLEAILPSPTVNGYRNKCEFTIGYGPSKEEVLAHKASSVSAKDSLAKESGDNESSMKEDGVTDLANVQPEAVVGFRLSDYKSGSCAVLSPACCDNVSQPMKGLAQDFEKFVRSSRWKPFDPTTQSGHWRYLLVRSASDQDIMIMVTVVDEGLSQTDIGDLTEQLQTYSDTQTCRDLHLVSTYLRLSSLRSSQESTSLVYGKEVIEERLLGMTFRITPCTFLQVNTGAAEVLYSLIGDWCSLGPATTLLDVCCGTGTIGLTVAKRVHQVVGIEIVPEAIEDAKRNAANNGINNVDFRCGKAEDVLPSYLESMNITSDTVAVLDPPRGGLHTKVIQAVRRAKELTRLIYVSCSPDSAMANFQDLMRPQSKRIRGAPFDLVRAVPVDLFPHTNHCELVLLFQREPSHQRPMPPSP